MLALAINATCITFILCLFSKSIRESVNEIFNDDYSLILAPSLITICIHVIWVATEGRTDMQTFGILTIYLLLPAILIWIAASKQKQVGCWQDFFTGIWLFAIPMILGKKLGGKNELPFLLSSVIFLAILFFTIRGLDLKLSLPKKFQSWKTALVTTLLLVGVLTPLGTLTNFIKAKGGFEICGGIIYPLHCINLIFSKIFSLEFLKLFVDKVLLTAVGETLVFQGILQGLMKEKLADETKTILLSALVFGFSHFNHGTSLAPWGWSWNFILLATIAGGGYAYLREKTESIIYVLLVHGFLDTITRTFFNFFRH